MFTEKSFAAVRKSGVTDYCSQVCGGGNCGNGVVCQYGIDSRTKMPLLDERFAESIIGDRKDAYDALEIHGVKDIGDPSGSDGTAVEMNDENPDFFSVYVHCKEGGVECVGDFGAHEQAVEYADELAKKYGWQVRDYSRNAKIQNLAMEFSSVLREWLSEEEMLMVLARNARENDPLICHSHDFCDANMAMDEAARNLGFKEIYDHGESEEEVVRACVFWSAAWAKAKASGFKVDKDSPKFDEIQQCVLESYEKGEFVNLEPGELSDCQDWLLKFLLVELSQKEGCENFDEAVRRVESAVKQLLDLRTDLANAYLNPAVVQARNARRATSLGG